MEIKQYRIVLVDLNPTIGAEIKNTRPCVVISPNEMNKFLKTVIIAPMTTSSKKYPSRIKVQYAKKKGEIALDQIKTIDKQRVINVLDKLKSADVKKVKQLILEMFVE